MSTPPRPLPPEVENALRKGQLIEAIKLLRKAQGYGLAEAKAALDAHVRKTMAGAASTATHKPYHHQTTTLRPRHPGLGPGEVPRGGGGGGAVVVVLAIGALAAWYWLRPG
jgi:hypothetical protein